MKSAPSNPYRITHWLFWLLPLSVWAVLYVGFSFNGLYGQDAHEYYRYSRALAGWVHGGVFPGKFFWPMMYPIYGAVIQVLTGWGAVAMQAVSVLAMVGSAYLMHGALRLMYADKARWSAVFVVFFFLGSPYLLRSGMQSMSDALTVFFLCVLWYAFLKYPREPLFRWLLLAAFGATSAIMTRYAAGVVGILPVLFLAGKVLTGKQWGQAAAAVGVSLVVALPHVILYKQGLFDFLNHNGLATWSVVNWFHRSFITHQGISTYPLPNLVYGFFSVFHPGYLLPGLVLVFFLKKEDFQKREYLVLVASVVLYGLFMAGIPQQNMRFLLLTFPAVIMVMFPAFARAIEMLRSLPLRRGLLAGVMLVQLALFARAVKPFVALSHLEQSAAQALHALSPATVYTFYVNGALENYGVKNPLINLWNGDTQDAQPGDLVLFHPTKFNAQWKGKPLLAHWDDLRNRFSLQEIKALPDGWKLYRLGAITKTEP